MELFGALWSTLGASGRGFGASRGPFGVRLGCVWCLLVVKLREWPRSAKRWCPVVIFEWFGCIVDVVVDDFVRLLGCSFPFNALPVPMLRQVYVFTFLVTFLVHCFRWSPQPPFGVGLGRSGALWAVFWCLWVSFGMILVCFGVSLGASLGYPVEM